MTADGDLLLHWWELDGGKIKARGPTEDTMTNPRQQGIIESSLIFSPNGIYLAGKAGSLRVVVWNTLTHRCAHDWDSPVPVHGIAFAPDSRHLALAASNGKVYLLRLPPPSAGKKRAPERVAD